MKRSKLLEIIKEVLDEQEGGSVGNVTGAVGPIATPRAFAKKTQGDNKATKMMKKTFGYTSAPRPKHPSSTKLIDYLQERGAGHFVTPNAFTSEAGMYEQDAVKFMEVQGMEVIGKPKHPSKKTIETYSDHKKK